MAQIVGCERLRMRVDYDIAMEIASHEAIARARLQEQQNVGRRPWSIELGPCVYVWAFGNGLSARRSPT
ncbi:hypothetical protein [Aquamicrobium sp. LC103]|uniref:hypothetical protein n=1 Tax=Aquamicrobium sp. LC103 TaxID=1120658 RepID=UPI00109D7294|nr:hypothetical protein [Aquamicrobium sp. LC103]TKT78169.1 hypothetical protein XW59_011060 [Aquamicrobium sp. LC103]